MDLDNTSTVIWFTGLSGSGKSALALELKKYLEQKSKTVAILDGDIIRSKLTKHLRFSREDIKENNKQIATVANEMKKEYQFILIPVIAPYREDREINRKIIGKEYIEIFVNCPIQKCIERDVKGLYQKALKGEIENFIGISKNNPYEPPLNPEITINTNTENITKSVEKIIYFLDQDAIK